MTASKSSRARNARAQANAARSRTAATARGNESGPAVKASSAAVKASSAVAVKTGAAVKSNGRNGTSPTQAVAARNGGLARGSRAQVAQLEPTDDGSATRSAVPLWMQIATFLLALAGLGVSIYLTIAHFTEAPLAGCSESGLVNCTKVTTSPQSYVFGIPVAVLGLAFYVAAVGLMSPWAWRASRREIHLARMASLVVGVGFVLYLLYAELFIIGSICLYCTSVHVITFVLFALAAFAAAAWGINPRRQSA
jgi:uncharacterized membrane protein